jgi:superfamily II DNA/RNA helicase
LKSERDLALVFCNRKHSTAKLSKQLSREGVHARCLNGDMTQGQRERTTADFRHKKFNVLVATDVAARGLHIDDITHVYNYEIPRDVETYTHRVGRTARAGEKGEAISLVATGEERGFFQRVLFTYKGSIVLKGANDIGYVKVKTENMPVQEKQEHSFSKHSSHKVFHPSNGGEIRSNRERRNGFPSRRGERSISEPFSKKRTQPGFHDSEWKSGQVNDRKGGAHKRKRPVNDRKDDMTRRIWDVRTFGEGLRKRKKKRLWDGR